MRAMMAQAAAVFPASMQVPASATTGTPIALAYGYVWATGKRAEYYQLQNIDAPNDMFLNYSRCGVWLLGEGEWDGCT